MTALPPDVVADLSRLVAELEQRLESSFAAHDAAIAKGSATEEENTRLQAELRAARDRQAATAEILRAIAGASGDAKHALQLIAETTARLFSAPSVSIQLVENGKWGQAYRFGDSAQRIRSAVPLANIQIGGQNMPGAVVGQNLQFHIPDLDHLDASLADWPGLPHARAAGTRTMCGTPLRREGKAIGALIVYRDRLAAFTDEELALLQSFADQAVIAIENAKLFNETQQSLARQTATSDILRVISQSPTDVQPVFDAIVMTAVRLLRCDNSFIMRCDSTSYLVVAVAGPDGPLQVLDPAPVPIDPDANFPSRAIISRKNLHLPDWSAIELPEYERRIREKRGFNSAVFLPLLREGECIGLLAFASKRANNFGESEIALAESFRDQALIAIENVRLFNETKEALERQTATADILKVIASSPDDVQPVFEAIAENARRLSAGHSAVVTRVVGEEIHLAAFTTGSEAGHKELQSSFPTPLSSPGIHSRVARTTELAFRTDIETEPDVSQAVRELARARGYRSILVVPMLRDGVSIGTIGVTRRDPGPFADHIIDLLKTFADQAVIAIENVRLFNETKEALERQTATAEILKVIASSPDDVQPVFDSIAASANKLLGGFSTAVFRFVGEIAHLAAFTPTTPEADDVLQSSFPMPLANFEQFELASGGQPVQTADVEQMPNGQVKEIARMRGFRSMLFVPLMGSGMPIGLISVTRTETGSFADHHVQLLQTFADQAVIAIENARLFNETQEALERQTATAEILNVIASSPDDVQPVFDAIAASGHRLLGGFSTTVFSIVDDILHLSAFTPTNPTADAALQASFPRPLSGEIWNARVSNGETVEIPDTETDPSVPEHLREMWRKRGFRSLLLVPLVRSQTTIGTINTTRAQPGKFSTHHVQLLQTFADQAVIAIENVRLFNETKEALERQTATAEILKVIASSPSDVQPVFDAIAASANRLLGGFSSTVFRFIDGMAHLKAFTPTTPEADEILQSAFPQPVADAAPFQMTQAGEVMQIPDTEAPTYELREIAQARGYRSMLYVPLMNKGASIGFIAVTRVQAGTFADHHVQLLQTFADQAVIAIENVRLFNETQEALERQTAAADILKVIASSPDDVQPVFDAIATSSKQLIGAFSATVFRFVDGFVNLVAYTPISPEADAVLKTSFPRPTAGLPFFELAKGGKVVQEADSENNPDTALRDVARARGFRSSLFAPLMNKGMPIGLIVVTRKEPGSFAEHHVQLLQTFADQAVIAIENVRLFDEVQARTRDLSESLQQQTATADVLKVISRSAFDLDTVMNTLTRSASELCSADMSGLFLREGDFLVARGVSNIDKKLADMVRTTPVRIDDQTYMGRTVLTGEIANLADVDSDPLSTRFLAFQKAFGYRSLMVVPLMREGRGVGVFALCSNRAGAFSQRQIELVQTFADQAVIAIENVRLFDEVQARTRDLTEALTYQTASGSILGVIASSPTVVEPALNAIVESACRLCGAYDASVVLKVDDDLYFSAHHGPIPFGLKKWPLNRNWVTGRSVVDKVPLQVSDWLSPEAAEFSDGQEQSRRQGHRCTLSVPLLRESEAIGAIVLRRLEPVAFSDKQIALLQTFADQAVIAIGNVRLFDEVQAKTRDLTEALTYQTGSSNILKVIASSPTDVGPVLKAIVESACELCDAYDALVRLKVGDHLEFSAHHGPIPVAAGSLPISRNWTGGLAVIERRPVHIHDLLSSEGDPFPEAQQRAREYGHRTILTVPLLREGESVGAIIIRRREVNPFTDKQIALLQTFADQAVIAIGNVRLFEEVQARTRDLSESLQQQTATADVLKVISRSAFDLQTVFDTLLSSAMELSGALNGSICVRDGDMFPYRASMGVTPAFAQFLAEHPATPGRQSIAGRVILSGEAVCIPDVLEDSDYKLPVVSLQQPIRSGLGVPLLRNDKVEGALVLVRTQPGVFDQRQIELVKTFADQAVIAIENVRLFDEVQAKTRDLTEALTYQTGSSNILSVIASSPTDVAPVLKAIVESACELCEAYDAVVLLKDGDHLRFSAHHGPLGINLEKWPISRNWTAGRAFVDRKPVHVRDLLSDEGAQFPDSKELSRHTGSLGMRSILSVPLLRENESIGTILLRRTEVQPFSDKQIALLQTFADQAVIAIGNVRLFDEVQARTRDLSESLQQQTATADVLKVISRSAFDLQPVLDVIVETSRELCGSDASTIFLLRDNKFHFAAVSGVVPKHLESLRTTPREIGDAGSVFTRVARQKRTLHYPNIADDPELMQGSTALGGPRALLLVPLMRDSEVIGAIVLRQSHLRPFTPRQIQAIEVFADQAVIAISNVGLFDEVQAKTRDLTEALTYQTGSSNILRVIASSPTDVGPVLKAIVESACELCEADDALATLRDGDDLLFMAQHGSIPVSWQRMPINRQWPSGRAVVDRKPVHVHDLLANEGEPFPDGQEMARRSNVRTVLSVPLLRENECIGAIVLRRTEVQPFSDKQISLLQTFADQAVIAIGNVRLFDEVQAKTRDLTEALTYQTGSSNILKVIASSPTDVEPVLKAIVESACELCGAYDALVRLKDGDGLAFGAHHGPLPVSLASVPITANSTGGLAVIERKPVHVHDLLSPEGDRFPHAQELARMHGERTILSVPLLRENESIGVIVLRRTEVQPFSEKQINLLQTFADQAVIAIGNVRLFDEVQARTRDLSESLQQQTATADVLKVISRSTFDLKAVLTTLVQSARDLCNAPQGMVLMRDGEVYRTAMQLGYPPEFEQYILANPVLPNPHSGAGRAAFTGQVAHFPDVLADPEYRLSEGQRIGGYRALLSIPLLREGEVVGVFSLGRTEPDPFSQRQIELVQTFADQAVIAIENVRLFEQVQTRTKELAASLDELRTAQDRLVQTEKLASLGQLTAGIAHEIKNPLNFVNNFSALSAELTDELNDLLKSATLTDKLREEVDELTGLLKDNLEKVVQHGKRADSIVKNMLLHSREGSGEPRPADINALLDESLNLAYHGARAEKPQFNVTLQRDFDQSAGTIEVFPQEITRVFLNLISNGFYAVTKRRAENGNSGFEPLLVASTRNLGDTVEIRIRDNGTGIPEEVREKMFNPFFTTKPAGEGTGLGLSMSHDIIVKQHGGRIDVATEPGQFTEFTILLPRKSSQTNNQTNKIGGPT